MYHLDCNWVFHPLSATIFLSGAQKAAIAKKAAVIID